jgi:hypothetical protein
VTSFKTDIVNQQRAKMDPKKVKKTHNEMIKIVGYLYPKSHDLERPKGNAAQKIHKLSDKKSLYILYFKFIYNSPVNYFMHQTGNINFTMYISFGHKDLSGLCGYVADTCFCSFFLSFVLSFVGKLFGYLPCSNVAQSK